MPALIQVGQFRCKFRLAVRLGQSWQVGSQVVHFGIAGDYQHSSIGTQVSDFPRQLGS